MSKVYLSCVSREFDAYRTLLTNDLRRANINVRLSADFGVVHGPILNIIDDYIRQSDAVVHLIGHGTGSFPEVSEVRALLVRYPDMAEKIPPLSDALSPSDSRISYVQWEGYLAIYHGRKTFIYLASDSAPRGPGFFVTPEEQHSQSEHIERIVALGWDRGVFENEERLSSKVLRDLYDVLPRLEFIPAQTELPIEHDTDVFEAHEKKLDDPTVKELPTSDEAPIAEHVRTHADDPARLDELGRRPFAEVIGQRLDEIWTSSVERRDAGAFMINLHGPWGAGKTSILNLLRSYLQDEQHKRPRPWVVVELNAWRQQRLRPPWWVLIKEVYRQSLPQVGLVRSLVLRVQWLLWRVRADWLPALLAIALMTLAVLLTTGAIELAPRPSAMAKAGDDSAAKAVELALKIVVAVAAAGASVVAFTRSLAFGSARAAQAYSELRSDPLGPIVVLFERLVRAIRNPVVIFIDDLDRCETAYVVELLEGIQTLFRSAPVVYVVAADRKWICTSFEKTYENFTGTIGEPGRPLGYLFLEKVFQVSASVPLISSRMRQTYWNGLLLGSQTGTLESERKKAEESALESVRGLRTKEELDAKIAEVEGDAVREPAMRAAAAKQITSAAAQQATKHRLEPCADLLESNPRAMKRLVNAFGLHQATHFLEGRDVSPEALARWTIIELRWPLLSDYLAAHPTMIAKVVDGSEAVGVSRDLKELFGDTEVHAVVAGGLAKMATLDEAMIRSIVGT